MYTAHNYQFLAASAAMEAAGARRSKQPTIRGVVSDEMLFAMPGADWYVAEMYTARVRFGLWDEILTMTAPTCDSRSSRVVTCTRAMALAAHGRINEGRATLAELQGLIANLAADTPAAMNSAKDARPWGAPSAGAHCRS
jgi:hypothetical protein